MSNRSVIPAFQASVGDWRYYICVMKYAEVARQIQFAHELSASRDVNMLIQRGLSNRTEAIKEYLLNSDHRFLGALVVAAWGGDPKYSKLNMADAEEYMSGMDRGFGVLSFDGSQSYFALDGQHRLKAIKEAVRTDPSIGKEEICVILVSHFDSDEGRERTRRLFTNINRNAKVTTSGENILLDEDDGASILTRRVLLERDPFRKEGVVKVFTKIGDDGELSIAGNSIPKTDPKAITSIATLKDVIQMLLFDQDSTVRNSSKRPSSKVLEESYDIVVKRLDDLFGKATGLLDAYGKVASARELRAPKNAEARGHPFMRPVIQKAVARVAREAVEQGETWSDTVDRLKGLPWSLADAPWNAVFNEAKGTMIAGKDHSNLLDDLLRIHLVPGPKSRVKAARRQYKDLRGSNYAVSEDDLLKVIIQRDQEGETE